VAYRGKNPFQGRERPSPTSSGIHEEGGDPNLKIAPGWGFILPDGRGGVGELWWRKGNLLLNIYFTESGKIQTARGSHIPDRTRLRGGEKREKNKGDLVRFHRGQGGTGGGRNKMAHSLFYWVTRERKIWQKGEGSFLI